MEFLVISKPKAEFIAGEMPADFDDLELKESAHAKRLYVAGSLRQVWGLVSKGRGAATIFEADSLERMQSIWNTFPLAEANYIDYQIMELAPYAAFGK